MRKRNQFSACKGKRYEVIMATFDTEDSLADQVRSEIQRCEWEPDDEPTKKILVGHRITASCEEDGRFCSPVCEFFLLDPDDGRIYLVSPERVVQNEVESWFRFQSSKLTLSHRLQAQ